MKNILRGLFDGTIVPWERRNPHCKERHEIVRKIEDEGRYFMQKMSLDDCERFQSLSNLYSQLTASEEENILTYGFTLGFLLAFDVMEESKNLFN